MKAGFPYALARLHARIGRRPGADARRRLLAVDDFGHFLQQAARAGFEPWLRNLGPASDAHAVELGLRETWRAGIGEVADWLPSNWQPALRWLAWAPDLPVLADVLEHGRWAGWMQRDPAFSRLPEGPGAAVREALRSWWPELDDHGDGEVVAAWRARAKALQPSLRGRARDRMEELLAAQIDPVDPEVLMRRFRRESGAPVRVFAWAGLARVDFAFLRGELVERRLRRPEAA